MKAWFTTHCQRIPYTRIVYVPSVGWDCFCLDEYCATPQWRHSIPKAGWLAPETARTWPTHIVDGYRCRHSFNVTTNSRRSQTNEHAFVAFDQQHYVWPASTLARETTGDRIEPITSYQSLQYTLPFEIFCTSTSTLRGLEVGCCVALVTSFLLPLYAFAPQEWQFNEVWIRYNRTIYMIA